MPFALRSARVVVLGAVVSLAGAGAQAATPPGTVISGRTTVSYRDAGNNRKEVVATSATVTVVPAPVSRLAEVPVSGRSAGFRGGHFGSR